MRTIPDIISLLGFIVVFPWEGKRRKHSRFVTIVRYEKCCPCVWFQVQVTHMQVQHQQGVVFGWCCIVNLCLILCAGLQIWKVSYPILSMRFNLACSASCLFFPSSAYMPLFDKWSPFDLISSDRMHVAWQKHVSSYWKKNGGMNSCKEASGGRSFCTQLASSAE